MRSKSIARNVSAVGICYTYEYGYYSKCATCKGDGIVAVRDDEGWPLVECQDAEDGAAAYWTPHEDCRG